MEPEGTRAWGRLLVLPFASLGALASWWPCCASGLGTHPGRKADCGKRAAPEGWAAVGQGHEPQEVRGS